MSTAENRAVYLRRRPRDLVTDGDVELRTEEVAPLEPGQALVEVHYLSLDASQRIWMSEADSYLPPSPLDTVVRAVGAGVVVESRRDDLPVGAHVVGMPGAQRYCVADDARLATPFTVLPDPLPAPLSAFLGPLGLSGGVTAYLGVDILDPRPGQTVVVTAAGGSVGSIAGQLAKARGARVVGVAGGPDKCAVVTDELGFDVCVDYKAPDWQAQLDAATPDGVDGVFENVGGEVFDRLLARLSIGGRVALCGMISQYAHYNSGGAKPGWVPQYNVAQVVMRRATITGFLCLDHLDRVDEAVAHIAGLLAEGRLTYRETVVDGLENLVHAMNLLYTGGNVGKLLLKVAA